MATVATVCNVSYAIIVSSDLDVFYEIRGLIKSDIDSPYAILVSSDFNFPYLIIVSSDVRSMYAIASISMDCKINYSVNNFAINDVLSIYELARLTVNNDVLSMFSILLSTDTQSVSSLSELIKNDSESMYCIFTNIFNIFESKYDVTNINKIHKDVLGIYMLYEAFPKIINVILKITLKD